MLDQALAVFGIKSDIDLNLMQKSQGLSGISAAVLTGMQNVFAHNRPDVVLVHGDTTTALATAMASFYSGIPVGHVEAGLRTYDVASPFPEEFNRQVIGRIAKWHFAPTAEASENLVSERVKKSSITVTGNTVIDSLTWVLDRINRDSDRRAWVHGALDEALDFSWKDNKFVLVTGHRRENFGEPLLQICYALRDLSAAFPFVHFVYPVHLNPSVSRPVGSVLSGIDNVHLVAPLDYENFIVLLNQCHFVLTDSGGIQEEAPSLGKPVLVMREVTERPQALAAGTAELVGSEKSKIVEGVTRLLTQDTTYAKMARAHNPFGDGRASQKIMEVLARGTE